MQPCMCVCNQSQQAPIRQNYSAAHLQALKSEVWVHLISMSISAGDESVYEMDGYFSTEHPHCMFGVPPSTMRLKRRLSEGMHVALPLRFSSLNRVTQTPSSPVLSQAPHALPEGNYPQG